MLAMVMSLKCFVCIFSSCISVLSVLIVCGVLRCVKCCVRLDVGDEVRLLVCVVCLCGWQCSLVSWVSGMFG